MLCEFTFEKESDTLMKEKIKIGFVGAGKVGCSLGILFSENGFELAGYYSNQIEHSNYAASLTNSTAFLTLNDLLQESDCIFLTVTDQQILPVWDKILHLMESTKIRIQFLFHCSGIHGSDIFHDASTYKIETGSFHPLCAVHSKEDGVQNLQTSVFSIEGSVQAKQYISNCCEYMKLSYVYLKPSDKIRYHAAAVVGSNLVLGLLKMSVDMLVQCGFNQEQAFRAIMNLAEGNIANIQRVGFTQALTGPIERNDYQTVNLHLEHLTRQEQQVYRILSSYNLEISKEKHPDWNFELLKEMLDHEKHSNYNVTTKGTE